MKVNPKPSAAVEEFLESVHARVGARTKAVLGRAGLFLALGIGVPPAFQPTDAKGKEIGYDAIVPDELDHVIMPR